MSPSPILWTLGLNHDSAPLDVRARFAFASSELPAKLGEVQSAVADLAEVALLSTCNRTELYGLGSQAQQASTIEWLASISGMAPEALRAHLYVHQEQAAARHVFRVASGLDSMVLGEPQILGQVKEAVRAAGDAGTLGTTLHQLFQQAFSVAKDVRTHTEIGAHSISMAAAATRLAAGVFEDWQHTRVLLVGAGEMIELCAAHFAAKNPKRLSVANRTTARGAKLAERFSTRALTIETFPLAELPTHLHQFDVVVSSTASTLPIIGLGAVQHAIKLRKHRPMVMVDLAVPRDIEPEVKELSDVYLYTVDDLSAVVQTNLANRAAAVSAAEKLVDAGVRDFAAWQQTRSSAVPKIQALHEQAAAWQEQEIERVKKQFLKEVFDAMRPEAAEGLADQGLVDQGLRQAQSEQVEQALRVLARNLSNKFLHAAILQIKESKEAL
ncbi:MAG: glutamyl-tRNA reductase [Cytophagales bacterium]|nr:glutamyl-tRNA reductase [Cytophagales bacterium]